MTERIIWLDNLKCFAIILVMLGHAIQYLCGSNYSENPFFSFIYSFHMPLFMAICGYFFRPSLSLDFSTFLQKKFIGLLLPALTWGLIKVILSCMGGDYLEKMIYSFWFLKSAFICYLVCYAITKILRLELAAYLTIVVFSLLFNLESGPFQLNTMLVSFVYGIFLSKYNKVLISNRKLLTPIFLLVYIVMYSNFSYNTPSFGKGNNFIIFFYEQGYKMVVGLSATSCLFLFFSWLTKSVGMIQFIGSSTLIFYVINCLWTDVQRHIFNITIDSPFTNLIVALAIVFVQIPIIYYLTKLIRKNQYSRLFLFGQR